MKDKQIVEEFKKTNHKIHPETEIHFYSFRVNRPHQDDSDYNVLVIIDDFSTKIRYIIYDIAWEIGFEHDAVISSVLTVKDEFGRFSTSPFHKCQTKWRSHLKSVKLNLYEEFRKKYSESENKKLISQGIENENQDIRSTVKNFFEDLRRKFPSIPLAEDFSIPISKKKQFPQTKPLLCEVFTQKEHKINSILSEVKSNFESLLVIKDSIIRGKNLLILRLNRSGKTFWRLIQIKIFIMTSFFFYTGIEG